MGVYQNGNEIIIDETFYVLTDPTKQAPVWPDDYVPADPTTVTFYLRDPDGNLLTYVNGIDTEVTHPSVGRYILTLAPTAIATANFWTYRVAGTGAVKAAAEGDFEILPSSVIDPVVSEPGFLPCQAWCDPQDIAERCSGAGSNWTEYEWAAQAASELLYQLSGEQFSGRCKQTVRPFNNSCGCWAWIVWPASPGVPQISLGAGLGWGSWGGLGWGWGFDGCGSLGGCGPVSRVLLPGYPVTSIVSVEIDGTTLDPAEYRLDEYQFLTRLNDVNGQSQFWPSCQNVSRPLGDPQTWGVVCTTGQAPPVLGQKAAAQLGCEIWNQVQGGQCALPQGTTQMTRLGVTTQMEPFRAWGQVDGKWATGLYMVDAFLAAYNPQGAIRRSTMWDPDADPFAVKLGTGSGV